MKIDLNIGSGDRVLRVIIGCVLIGLGYSSLLTGGVAIAAYVVGAVIILTGVIRFCPAYKVFNINTGSDES